MTGTLERADGQAVLAGHHHVQDDDVGPGFVEDLTHFGGVAGHGDTDAVLAEVFGQQRADLCVVVHYQDVIGRFLIGLLVFHELHRVEGNFLRKAWTG